jgi:hypothetical protein
MNKRPLHWILNDAGLNQKHDSEQWAQANRAFELFTLEERLRALERFAELRYPSIADRFFEAVHSVIIGNQKAKV